MRHALGDDRAGAVREAEQVDAAAELPATISVLVERGGLDEVAQQLTHEEGVPARVVGAGRR